MKYGAARPTRNDSQKVTTQNDTQDTSPMTALSRSANIDDRESEDIADTNPDPPNTWKKRQRYFRFDPWMNDTVPALFGHPYTDGFLTNESTIEWVDNLFRAALKMEIYTAEEEHLTVDTYNTPMYLHIEGGKRMETTVENLHTIIRYFAQLGINSPQTGEAIQNQAHRLLNADYFFEHQGPNEIYAGLGGSVGTKMKNKQWDMATQAYARLNTLDMAMGMNAKGNYHLGTPQTDRKFARFGMDSSAELQTTKKYSHQNRNSQLAFHGQTELNAEVGLGNFRGKLKGIGIEFRYRLTFNTAMRDIATAPEKYWPQIHANALALKLYF